MFNVIRITICWNAFFCPSIWEYNSQRKDINVVLPLSCIPEQTWKWFNKGIQLMYSSSLTLKHEVANTSK